MNVVGSIEMCYNSSLPELVESSPSSHMSVNCCISLFSTCSLVAFCGFLCSMISKFGLGADGFSQSKSSTLGVGLSQGITNRISVQCSSMAPPWIMERQSSFFDSCIRTCCDSVSKWHDTQDVI